MDLPGRRITRQLPAAWQPGARKRSGRFLLLPAGRAAASFAAVLFLLHAAIAEDESPSAPAQAGAPADGAQPGTASASQGTTPNGGEPVVAVPYSSIFRDTTFPYTQAFNNPEPEATVRSDNINGSIYTAGDYRIQLPFAQQGFAPEDADLKLGPVYIKFRDVNTQWLYSDNANHTTTNRESGVIGLIRLDLTVIAQLSENLNVAIGGSIYYLPMDNQFGLNKFGRDAFLLGILGPSLIRGQINYDTILAGWPVVFSDDFGTRYGEYSYGTSDDFHNFNETNPIGGVDRLGRYSFGAFANANGNTNRAPTRDFLNDDSVVAYSNTISASTDRLFPGSIRLHVLLANENLWYNQGNRGLPSERALALVSVKDERENLRFKPFFLYEGVVEDRIPGISNTFEVGVQGPITDQLNLTLDVGYYENSAIQKESVIGYIELSHIAGPYTTEYASAGRTVNYFRDEIYDYADYDLHQILGPSLNADFFAEVAKYTPLISQDIAHRDTRFGLRLNYDVSPKTTISAGSTYTYEVALNQQFNVFTERVVITHLFTDTFSASLLYQFQKVDATAGAEDSFYENLLYLSLTKYFQ